MWNIDSKQIFAIWRAFLSDQTNLQRWMSPCAALPYHRESITEEKIYEQICNNYKVDRFPAIIIDLNFAPKEKIFKI